MNMLIRTGMVLAVGALVVGLSGCNGVTEGSPCLSTRDCSGAGLLCDLDHAECVQCLSNTDCFGAGEICAGRRCVVVTTCESSRQCPGQVCDTGRGYCVDCVSDTDCPGDELCDADGYCEPPPTACESDRQCSSMGQVCDAGAGLCVDCVVDADCDPGRICNGARRCVTGAACSPGTVECVGTGGTRTCDSTGNWGATAACLVGTCSDGVCTDGSCVPSCGSGESCVGGVCSCGGGAACGGAQTCVSGVCRSADTCVPACALGETCEAGSCRCGAGPACTGGAICALGMCIGAPGCTSSDCGLSPQCGCGIGEGCYLDSASVGTANCYSAGSGTTNSFCDAETDCAPGYVCKRLTETTGRCAPFCRSDSECSSAPGAGCAIHLTGDGISARNEGVFACSLACNPVTNAGCPSGEACAIYSHPDTTTERWVTGCRAIDAPTGFCTSHEQCPAGSFCNPADIFGACVDYCVYPSGSCSSGSCQRFDSPFVIGSTEYGYCGT